MTTLQTRRGARVHVREWGNPGAPPLVFLHGVMGLLTDARFLEDLARDSHVFAPELPGFGHSQGEDLLEDMLDFALHGWDIIEALELESRPVLVGHSLGGMIAAEMACLAPRALAALVLINPFGLWLDEAPIPDLFAMLPFEFGEYLFVDRQRAQALLAGASDVAEPDALMQFVIDNTRQLGTAGKILFPIPNRRLAKRLYRVTTPTQLVWGAEDRLMPPEAYLARWQALLPHAHAATVAGGGHMLPYEQPRALLDALSVSGARAAPGG